MGVDVDDRVLSCRDPGSEGSGFRVERPGRSNSVEESRRGPLHPTPEIGSRPVSGPLPLVSVPESTIGWWRHVTPRSGPVLRPP